MSQSHVTWPAAEILLPDSQIDRLYVSQKVAREALGHTQSTERLKRQRSGWRSRVPGGRDEDAVHRLGDGKDGAHGGFGREQGVCPPVCPGGSDAHRAGQRHGCAQRVGRQPAHSPSSPACTCAPASAVVSLVGRPPALAASTLRLPVTIAWPAVGAQAAAERTRGACACTHTAGHTTNCAPSFAWVSMVTTGRGRCFQP